MKKKKFNTLRFIRVMLAICSLLAVTLLFIDVTFTARHYWPWMTKIQFVPAVLSANFIALAIIIAVTLLFGRLYCSVICPLGIFQDVISRIRGWISGKKGKNRFRFKPAATKTRVSVLTVFTILLGLGLFGVVTMALCGLIDPYSAYGRISSQIFGLPVAEVNNLLADAQVDMGSYSFTTVAWSFSLPVFIIAAITLIVITIFAAVGGREYCNRICPVGTLLGYISKYSLMKIKINTSKCNGCRKCERNCKSSCIDYATHTVDMTRCVSCMDCIGNCSTGAISFKLAFAPKKSESSNSGNDSQKPASSSRRNFMITAAAVGGALAAKAIEHGDGALAPVKEKTAPPRLVPVTPPGSGGIDHLSKICTGCQLCIQNCPNSVLKPSTDIATLMQPTSVFTEGYCRPGCTVCGHVCPAGAILPITREEKTSIKTGNAEVDVTRCISAAFGQHCGNCARKCPTGAITMEPMSDHNNAHLRPVVNPDMCIGCGACEYNCPVGAAGMIDQQYSAIFVNGLRKHRPI